MLIQPSLFTHYKVVKDISQYSMYFWEKFQSRKIQIVTSELTLMEILVQPLKLSNSQIIRGYERFLTESDIQLMPISRQILKEVAQLRSIKRIKTLDAIHASTAWLLPY